MSRDFTTALKLFDEKKRKTYLPTSCSELDRLLGKGIEPGVFYLFYGGPESGIDLILHRLMASVLKTEDGPSKVVYLNCGNYREEKTVLNIPFLVSLFKTHKLDAKVCLERILVFCAFSEEQQEQVVEEVVKVIEKMEEAKLLIVHNIAKLFVTQRVSSEERYRRTSRLQKVVLRLWQKCAARSIAMVASCRPVKARRGSIPKPEGGRYLSHEANVIVYLEKVGGLIPTTQAYLLKHPAKPHRRAVLNIEEGGSMGRITVPFKMRLEQELESLKGFRDALTDLERQAAYDQIVKVCTSEQGAMANANIPAILDAMLLTASVDNHKCIEHLSKRVNSLEKTVRKLKSQAHSSKDVDD
jgi:RecA/RadA recombinase